MILHDSFVYVLVDNVSQPPDSTYHVNKTTIIICRPVSPLLAELALNAYLLY